MTTFYYFAIGSSLCTHYPTHSMPHCLSSRLAYTCLEPKSRNLFIIILIGRKASETLYNIGLDSELARQGVQKNNTPNDLMRREFSRDKTKSFVIRKKISQSNHLYSLLKITLTECTCTNAVTPTHNTHPYARYVEQETEGRPRIHLLRRVTFLSMNFLKRNSVKLGPQPKVSRYTRKGKLSSPQALGRCVPR